MGPFVRRSLLTVGVLDRTLENSWAHNADAVILDLGDTVPDREKAVARGLVRESIPMAAAGRAEVFVRVNRPLAHADIEASVWPGLRGIVHAGAESANEMENLDSLLTGMERLRGIPEHSLQIIVLLQSGKGVWNIREIVRASSRISSAGLDEINLCKDLGIVPSRGFDPFEYAKGRIVIEGRAAKVQPVGINPPHRLLARIHRRRASG